MARNLAKEIKRLEKMLNALDVPDTSGDLLPSANGIDRIVFQARFIIRALKQDPVGLSAIIEATRASMLANLRNRPELAGQKVVAEVLESQA